jgi:hypothetical protein
VRVGELDGIGEEVGENMFESELIGIDEFRHIFFNDWDGIDIFVLILHPIEREMIRMGQAY